MESVLSGIEVEETAGISDGVIGMGEGEGRPERGE